MQKAVTAKNRAKMATKKRKNAQKPLEADL